MNHPIFLMCRAFWLSSRVLCIAALVALGCKKAASEQNSHEQSVTPAPASAAAPRAQRTPDPQRNDADLKAASQPAPSVEEEGVWVDSDKYEFKLVRVEPCIESAGRPNGPTDRKAGKQPTGTTPEGMKLLGVRVQIRPKVGEFFVSPRHATLHDGGLRFEPKLGQPVSSCTPTLKPATLKKGEIATGFIVFEMPAKHGKLVLQYQPVRWGGAGSVRVAVQPVEHTVRRSKTASR